MLTRKKTRFQKIAAEFEVEDGLRGTFVHLIYLLFELLSYETLVTNEVDAATSKEIAHLRRKVQTTLTLVKDIKGKPLQYWTLPAFADFFQTNPLDNSGELGAEGNQLSQQSMEEELLLEIRIKNLLKALLPSQKAQGRPLSRKLWH